MDCTNFLQSTKSPHFPLLAKVGQLIKRKRVLCWSIYIISLCLPSLHSKITYKMFMIFLNQIAI